MAPAVPDVRVSALGTEAVVDGCLGAAAELAWARLTVDLPAMSPAGAYRSGLAASGLAASGAR